MTFFFDNYNKMILVSLFANAIPVIVSSKYSKFVNIFSLESIAKLPKYININNYAINLVESQ